MPDQKISALTELTAVDAADLVEVVDVSDGAMSAAGTNKRVTVANLKTAVAGSVASDALWDAKGDLAAGTGANTASKLTVGSNGHVLTADSGQATGLSWVSPGAGIFGTGVDGSLTISANTTWTNATMNTGVYQFTDLTIDAGKTLTIGDQSAGNQFVPIIMVNGTLTLNGTIFVSPSWAGYRFAASHGLDGGAGGATTGSAGSNATTSLGGAGGAGGNGSSGNGGAGGTSLPEVSGTKVPGGLEDGVYRNISNVLRLPNVWQANGVVYQARGGAGGGGGGGDGTAGADGGCGGGVIVILARNVAGTGTIDASGKAGNNAAAGNRGGGGGGGGGVICVWTRAASVGWTLSVGGGAGGNGFGTGTAGASGNAGTAITITGVM